MPAFAYRAVHTSGRVANGQMNAANENELAHYLSESGMELIEAREKKERVFCLPLTGHSVAPRAIAAFCSRMHDLLRSGIPFLESLREVAAATDNKILRDALMQISQALSNGGGIAASFALYPSIFASVFIAIIGAGENSGDMTVIFDFLARYAENRATTQERLRRALRYPLFLLVVAGGAVGFMLTMVVPQMVQFIAGLQSHLPFATRVLVILSKALTDYGVIILAGFALAVGGLFGARLLFPVFAAMTDSFILRLPVIGKVIVKTSLARYAHSFAILFRSGCDVPACLRQSRETVSNRALQAGFGEAEQRVQAGASLSQGLDRVMPGFAVGLLRTGERSGNLAKSWDDIATTYDREAQAATDTFIGLLEPSLTLMIGGVLAWTVLAVLGPLYGSLGVLGGRM